MLDATAPPGMQRSRGHAYVRMGPRGVIDLAQSGSAKAMLPRVTTARAESTVTAMALPEIVFLNTSGGLASGDILSFAVDLDAGSRALATTQTAERAYRANGGPARAQVAIRVGAGGWLDWLPQETILFDGAKLIRDTTIDLAPDAGCLALEMTVLGRLAMGETLSRLHLRDRRVIRQGGRVIHHDALSLDDAALTKTTLGDAAQSGTAPDHMPHTGPGGRCHRGSAAMLGPARAMATLVLIAPHAADLLTRARDVLDEPGVVAAASAPPAVTGTGRLIVRALAVDDWPLRRQINRLLGALRPSPLPRIWQV